MTLPDLHDQFRASLNFTGLEYETARDRAANSARLLRKMKPHLKLMAVRERNEVMKRRIEGWVIELEQILGGQ